MNAEATFGGSLFASEFLAESVRDFPEWNQARTDLTSEISARLRDIRGHFPARQSTSEAVTEDELIWKMLGALGWNASLRQQNLSLRGHYDIPDGLLFTTEADKVQALRVEEPAHRYTSGVCLVESKRWNLNLDRPSGSRSTPFPVVRDESRRGIVSPVLPPCAPRCPWDDRRPLPNAVRLGRVRLSGL